MPLVLLCGYPSSGKTRRTEELADFLRASCDQPVHVVTDDWSRTGKNETFVSNKDEKMARGDLKSSAERLLSPEAIVILDTLNYIKGCRYELFCLAKHVKTPHCIVQCGTSRETAKQWNSSRGESELYSDEVFDALVMRFEAPDSRNRWDSPLFILHPDDPLPGLAIVDVLLHRKPAPPNQSTQSQPLSATSFLHELDRRTQEVVSQLLEAQRTSLPGENVTIAGSEEKLLLPRRVTMAELRGLRRQFISYTKLHPVEDHTTITSLFAQFLNSSL